jgi:hypothetical protein
VKFAQKIHTAEVGVTGYEFDAHIE